MLASFSEFKFFQSFRVSVEEADNLRFMVEREDNIGRTEYINDAKLVDISITGFGFKTKERISVGTNLTISLQFKKHHLDLTGRVVRAFSQSVEDKEIIYGVELDSDPKIKKFLETYITNFSTDRLKECLIDSALKERYTKASDGFEMFSLLLSLFKDITHFGNREGFLENMLEEVVRIMNAQRASIFLIDPEKNELEAISALGVEKKGFRFDYRLGIAGNVFTTGIALNIDTINDKTRFNPFFDQKFEFSTRSIICHPLHNREDKIVGVIEVLNKRNQDRFTVEDEKTMKVLSLVFSSLFHNYNPISESSQIRRFSTPFDREYALIGKTTHVASLRNIIVKTKDIDVPLLIYGESGVGKSLVCHIIHNEGRRGLNSLEIINCHNVDKASLEKELFGPSESDCKLTQSRGGVIVLNEVSELSIEHQRRLLDILKARGIPEGKLSLDVRIMATTTNDIGKMVDEGTFSKELYQYLSKIIIHIEPLRRRIEDLDALVDYFLKTECKKQGFLLKTFSL